MYLAPFGHITLPSVVDIDAELLRRKYSEDQPRDDQGQWTEGGTGGGDGGTGDGESRQDPTARLRPLSMQQHRTLNQENEKWAKGLSAAQRAAVGRYTSDDGFAAINRGLRKGESIEQEVVGHLDNALASSKVPETITVYRGVRNFSYDKVTVGQAFRDKAYASTTARLSKAKEFAGNKGTLLAITVPAGSRGGYLDVLSGFDESELLLPRGSLFRINRKERKGGRQVIHVEVMAP